MGHVRLPLTTQPRQDIDFVYKAYNNLVRQLGAIDGFSSAIFLAGRYLRSAAGASSADQRAFVTAEAQRHSINTRFVDFLNYERHASQLALAGVFQQFEVFCDGLKIERARMDRPWPQRPQFTTDLEYALMAVAGDVGGGKAKVGEERGELFEYYRLLRNFFAHGLRERTKADEAFAKVQHHQQLVASQYHLNAPNRYDDLQIDDYLLATRLCKYIATDICRLAKLASAEELITLLYHWRDNDPLTMLAGKRSSSERLLNSLRSLFRSHYNYFLKEHVEIEAGIVDWLMELPTRKARKQSGRGTIRAHVDAERKSRIEGADGE